MTRTPTGRVIATGVVGAALVFGLAACSGDDDAGNTIDVTTRDYEFEPDSWQVTAGEEFTVNLTNEGPAEHEWAVLDQGVRLDSEDQFTEDAVLLEVEAVPAGETTTQSFTIDQPGTYQVICAIDTHFDQGMEGTLTVE